MDKRGLTDLGYLLFLDRYALKDGKRESLVVGDTVLLKVDNQKVIGTVTSMDPSNAIVDVDGRDWHVPIETLDKPLELDPKQMWQRVARAVAEAETSTDAYETCLEKFEWLLEDWKFLPGGRILAAAGSESELTCYNCYVIPSPKDSKDAIFNTLNVMAQIMSRGGGVGINISSLRPRYAYTRKTNGRSSGAVSWGEIYSYTTGLIEQAGSRRGALMLILDDWHPDLLEFIDVKRQAGKIINANISVGVSDEFMKAVELDKHWDLVFPDTTDSEYDNLWTGDLKAWRAAGKSVKLYKTVRARELWDKITSSAWACAEPGVWFKGRANAQSNSQYYNQLVATNPCGEQPLPPWAVCLLGSINLSKFLTLDRNDTYEVKWAALERAVRTAVRFMDNVIDITPYIYPEMEMQQKSERRIGLGTMGLAEMLIRLEIRYGSDESLKFIDNLFSQIRNWAYDESANLAAEKGRFPKYEDGIMRSPFIHRLPLDIGNKIAETGLRNVTLLTQAPTGTIGTMVNTSTGIEPFYYWEYERKGQFGSYMERVAVYEEWCNNVKLGTPLPDYFITAQDLSPEAHIRVQASIQQWVDSSISKTCNVPNNYTVEQVRELYELMYLLGCKGGTVYRDGSRSEQVLNLKSEEATTPQESLALVNPSDARSNLAWRKRPASLSGVTYHKQTPVGTAYITINRNGTDEPFETFINIGRAGSDIAADAEGLGRLISLILRMPSPLSVQERIENIAAQLDGIGSGRSYGFGKNRVMSLPDAIAQVLAEHAGVADETLPGLPEYEDEPRATVFFNGNGDYCPGCGNLTLQRVEGCKKCYGCGYSEC